MKHSTSAYGPSHIQPTPEAQAASLWAYVKAKAPHFTMDGARDVVRQLNMQPGEDLKSLAKRLAMVLKLRRITLKHINALHAAAGLYGFASLHTYQTGGTYRLAFATFDDGLLEDSQFHSWDALAIELRKWADQLLARGRLPLGVLTLSFTSQGLSFSAPMPPSNDDARQTNQDWPLGVVTAATDDPHWLDGASAALEKLRRHLEEDGHAVLDGYAVLRLCAASQDIPGHPTAVTAADVVNSELVLMREDDEDDPYSSYEVARGDELSCWYQLELALRNNVSNEMPSLQITIPKEGGGVWHVNGIRYVWAVETLKPEAYVPGRINRQIGIPDCQRLLHRYRLAKSIHGKTFKHREHVKRLDYLSGPPDTYRVDLHFLLHELNRVGLTWDSYIRKFDVEPLSMTNILPVGFVFQMLENLEIEKPNQVFAKPNLSEMFRISDDGLLRALMPRVDQVRSIKPIGLEDDQHAALRAALEEFAGGLHAQKMLTNGGLLVADNELPHLVWAVEAEEFRLTVEGLGLVMHAAIVPHLHSTLGILPEVPGVRTWPWAFGNALFLRFEREGGVR